MRDTVIDVEKLKKESTDNIIYYKNELDKLRAESGNWKKDLDFQNKVEAEKNDERNLKINQEMTKSTIQFTEVLGKINVTLERLEGAVKNLNETVHKEERNRENSVNRLYESFAELKDDTRREIELLRK